MIQKLICILLLLVLAFLVTVIQKKMYFYRSKHYLNLKSAPVYAIYYASLIAIAALGIWLIKRFLGWPFNANKP